MMTLHLKKLIAMSLLLVFLTPASADLKQDSTVIITGGKALPTTTRVGSSDPSMADPFSFDNKTVNGAKKTLRCWQEGVMIVAEQDWNLAVTHAPILVNNKSQKAYAFDYSDTFCLYIGG